MTMTFRSLGKRLKNIMFHSLFLEIELMILSLFCCDAMCIFIYSYQQWSRWSPICLPSPYSRFRRQTDELASWLERMWLNMMYSQQILFCDTWINYCLYVVFFLFVLIWSLNVYCSINMLCCLQSFWPYRFTRPWHWNRMGPFTNDITQNVPKI